MGLRRTRRDNPTAITRGNATEVRSETISDIPDIPMGALRSIDDSYGYLRSMGSQVTARGHRHGRFHVSDICSKCPRKMSLIYHLDQYHVSDLLWPISGVTFTIGDAIHDLVRNRFQHASPEKFYGKWSCACTATVTHGTWADARELCNTCGTHTDEYVEMVYTDEDHNLTAAVDMVKKDVIDGEDVYTVGEIKSCASRIFDSHIENNRPDPNHILQASFYHRMLLIHGYTVSDKISIIYVCKENRFGQAYKEFRVEPNVRQVDAELLAVREILNNGLLPPRANSCSAFGEGDSKRCGCAATCFSIPETIQYFKDI